MADLEETRGFLSLRISLLAAPLSFVLVALLMRGDEAPFGDLHSAAANAGGLVNHIGGSGGSSSSGRGSLDGALTSSTGRIEVLSPVNPSSSGGSGGSGGSSGSSSNNGKGSLDGALTGITGRIEALSPVSPSSSSSGGGGGGGGSSLDGGLASSTGRIQALGPVSPSSSGSSSSSNSSSSSSFDGGATIGSPSSGLDLVGGGSRGGSGGDVAGDLAAGGGQHGLPVEHPAPGPSPSWQIAVPPKPAGGGRPKWPPPMPKKQNLTNEPKKELARAIKEKKLKLQQEEKQRIENQHRREKDGTAMREKGVLEATASQGPHGNGWLDGFQRAKLAKECRDKFSLPKIQECEALPCINSELKMVYMLVSKAGSSTLREAVKPFVGYQKATSTAWSDQYTWFTEVRDPLSRAVSSFLEEGHACRQNNFQGLEKGFQGTLKNPNGSALALAIFESWIANLEKGLCWGGHSRPQLCRIPIPGKYFNIERSMDYVGLLDHLDEDWKVMGAFQEKVFGVSLPVLPKPQRVKPHSVVSLLNVGVLPKSLKQRICTLFKVDYCCFRMKVPQACKIEC